MTNIQNTLLLLKRYNALIKYHLKAYEEGLFDARKIDLDFENIPDIDAIKSEIKQTLQKRDYSEDFVCLVNRLYLLSQSNSDLFAIHSAIEKHIYKVYPFAKNLERLSFGIYEFIRDDASCGKLRVIGLDKSLLSEMVEFQFKNDEAILWQTYYLLQNITDAYLRQEKQDIEHQLSFKSEPDKDKFIQQQKERRAEEIIHLSNGFCDKNLTFMYAQGDPIITQNNLFCFLLSEVMNNLSSEEYAKYVELDYQVYQRKNYQWNFASSSLSSYSALEQLFGFTQLVRILANAMLIKDYMGVEAEGVIESIEKGEDIKRVNKAVKPEYILAVPILDLIHREFNDELWDNITLIEFLNVFTTEIKKQDNFNLKPKQTTRFYYLLKKIWINSPNKSLFNTEKEWTIPFLQNYNLSYSAYTNQFIKKEGGLKHQKFTKSVDKILPKDEIG